MARPTTPESDNQIWERQESDTAKSYQAFCDYRDMGVKRSLRALHSRYSGQLTNKPPTQSWMTISGWSHNHNWQERVKAYDAHQQHLIEQEHEQARKQIIEDELADYHLQLDKWRDAYDRTKLHERRSRKERDDGSIIELIELEVTDWHNLSKWRDEVAKQGRRALGMPDKIEKKELDLNIDSIIFRTGQDMDDL